MGKTLIREAVLVTMDDRRPDYFTGDLLIRGDRIEEVSDVPGKLDPGDCHRIIDGRNLVVLPGLINTHGHAAMSLFRGYADDLPLKEWLEGKIWPAEERLQAEDVYWGTMLSIAEMIRGGTTTFTDMYFFMDKVAEAAAEAGIRAVLARGLIGLGEGAGEALKEGEKLIDDWHGKENGRINVNLGPHAPYTCPPEFLKKVIEAAGRTGRPLQIHLAETAGEVEECRAKYSLTPVQLMEQAGLFRHRVVAAHCVHLEAEDIRILAERKVGVAHNPGSNLKLGSGVAPLKRLLEAGVKVGLGTDGAASNNNLDLWEEMRLAALLAKGLEMDPTLVTAMTALKMATVYGAEILSLEQVGQLLPGYKADLVGIGKDVPHLSPLHDPVAHLVYSASAADVQLVMVDGEILLEDGRLTRLDEERIIYEASRCAARLTGGSPRGD